MPNYHRILARGKPLGHTFNQGYPAAVKMADPCVAYICCIHGIACSIQSRQVTRHISYLYVARAGTVHGSLTLGSGQLQFYCDNTAKRWPSCASDVLLCRQKNL